MIASVRAWAMVPARGGSKSIPYKNLVLLGGIPMLDFGVRAAQAFGSFERIICSTEDDRIAIEAERLGVEVDWRPAELATDDAEVEDAAREMLSRHGGSDGTRLPDVLVLIQPTNPFVDPNHFNALLEAMRTHEEVVTAQTITAVPHNYHAWAQRVFEDGRVRFRYPEERKQAYNKQRKPTSYKFANLVSIRPRALLTGASFFDTPSAGVEVPWPYDLDVDGPDDVRLANALLAAGLVDLPFLSVEAAPARA